MDRLKLSHARQWLNTGSAGARLGLGSGYVFDLDVVAASHAGLNLGRARFDAVAEGLQTALGRAGIPYWTQNRLAALLAPMQRGLVTQ